ncbi:uncharacterized protein K02A2.6-like [Nematostella vectensis]|uniref:uncharacterized protein K02A2.6-like n=1 Tax=Nematostella vectensis TaxID=45351 RepID=UPI00207789D6|nr:uncharacterized protein K02A2.6-like [Nematostella vectensis]
MTCEDLELVKYNLNLDKAPKAQSHSQHGNMHTPLTKGKLVNSYRDRFEGLGAFKMRPYHITLEEGAEPVIHPPRSVPVHLRELYKQEIDTMLEAGIIEPVDTPTDWVNSIVLTETTNDKGEITKIRVCLDPRDLNKWIKREPHYTKTVDEVVTQLIDAKFKFSRLPFGLVVSQDIFQRQLDSALEGLNGVTSIADDIIVYGSTEEEHDRNLTDLMERAQEKGIVFNAEKLQFKCNEVSFFGHTWSPEGVPPDKKKVSAILDMEAPKDTKNLQSFLEHDEAFKKVKEEISSLGVLRYFDPKEETVIQTDASLKGVGAVLLQGGQPVCYASKALTETEQNYSNIEREALGVVWELERFHYFIYGKQCTVNTDHKPLESIFKKKLTSCPARLQRFVLRALKYDVTVKYVKGSDVSIADALSRLSPQPAPPKGQLPQLSIHQVTDTLPASPAKLQQIRDLTTSDPTLSQLRDTICKGWPESREKCPSMLYDYWNFREELTIEDGLVLKGEKIVIPPTLRPEILDTLHKGHLAQEKFLLRARTSVFWPGITKDVVNLVKICEACQKQQRHNQKPPILQPEPPR